MDWDRLRVFRVVAEAGSFTQAGDTLHLSQSAVSRQISALETSLNVKLFHRHARGLVLTEQGEILDRAARDVFARLSTAEAMVKESREAPSGVLRITTPVSFGSVWLTPQMDAFMDAYPEIEPHLILTDEELDVSMRKADIAIRVTPPTQPELISRKLMVIHNEVYAAPAYAERHGLPQSTAELEKHRIVIYGDESTPPTPGVNWLADLCCDAGVDINPRRMMVNNIYAISQAVCAGLGIGVLPSYLAARSPELIRVMPHLKGPEVQAHFVYAEDMRHSARLSAFREFLLTRCAEHPT